MEMIGASTVAHQKAHNITRVVIWRDAPFVESNISPANANSMKFLKMIIVLCKVKI